MKTLYITTRKGDILIVTDDVMCRSILFEGLKVRGWVTGRAVGYLGFLSFRFG